MLSLPLFDNAGVAFTSVDAALAAYFSNHNSDQMLFKCGCSSYDHVSKNQLQALGERFIIKLDRFESQVRVPHQVVQRHLWVLDKLNGR